jgi:hypothetical protein
MDKLEVLLNKDKDRIEALIGEIIKILKNI